MWEWNVICTIQEVPEDGLAVCMCIYTFGKDSVFFSFFFCSKFNMSSLIIVI